MPVPKPFDDIDVPDDFVLPEGNVVRGQLLFKKHCAQCHTIRRDGTNPYGTLLGPNLYGVMGRTAAMNQRSGWAKYSTKLESSGILWTERNMMAFLKNPKAFVGGVINMNFRGIESWQDRVDLIHYLQRAGHESWMVQDGTPHTQKQWWTRGISGPTQSYWEVNATSKQLKPWQHAWRSVSQKVEDTKRQVWHSLGILSAGDDIENEVEDKEISTWRRLQKVENAVMAASMKRSYNWPPPEVIQEGPQRKVSPAPPPAPPPSAFEKTEVPLPSNVAACEERAAVPRGTRAPSSPMVGYHQAQSPSGPAPYVRVSVRASEIDGSQRRFSLRDEYSRVRVLSIAAAF
ncbi:unnamed protein product [Cladocopium goreaui]|uniref:Cytochrome C, putative n=1 Tax=Cladocopium goreaui TaxID=2562237 RepID=A0A9P1FJ55_9DINO|nr:unnamed protein product [Cladocopium goreaui]